MTPEDILKKHYNPRLKAYKETHKILDWESREAQYARFRILLENVPLEGKSLLDVGCGCGDLLGLFREEQINVDYTGVDILSGMIEKAREIHRGGLFVCGDMFANPEICGNHYDVLFASGIFNLNLGNNSDFFSLALDGFSRLAGSYLVINLLDEASPGRDEKYFYFSPEQTAGQIAGYGWQVEIIRGYLNNDFTLIASRSL